MAKSRYSSTGLMKSNDTLEPVHYATWNFPLELRGLQEINLLPPSIDTTPHTWGHGDRIDKLANKYYGDDQFWWVIALVNNIQYPLGIKVGTVLTIPTNVIDILKLLGLM